MLYVHSIDTLPTHLTHNDRNGLSKLMGPPLAIKYIDNVRLDLIQYAFQANDDAKPSRGKQLTETITEFSNFLRTKGSLKD